PASGSCGVSWTAEPGCRTTEGKGGFDGPPFFLWPQPCAGLTIRPTMRRTTGRISSKVGKATSQDRPQADIQVEAKAGAKPRLRAVAMAETTKVISSDRTSGVATAP